MKKDYTSVPESRCGMCAHFVRHYVQGTNGRLVPLSCGHCVIETARLTEKKVSCPANRETEEENESYVTYPIKWKWD